MRRSAMVTLTLLPILASAAVAAADPPEPAGETAPPDQTAPPGQIAPPGMTPPTGIELSPPGMTPDIEQLECDEDSNRDLRMDCERLGSPVIRGGFGHYFHHGRASSGG